MPPPDRNKVYERMQITAADVVSAPQITHELRAIARYLKERNRPSNPYYYLAASDHPDAMAVLFVYRKWHRRYLLPIEAYCVAAKVPTLRILEIVAATTIRLGAQACSIVAAASMPDIVHKTVEMALTNDGFTDRALLAKATGFLPTPKGPQTSIHVTQNAVAQASAPVAVAAPAPEQTIRRMVDRFNTHRSLPPSSAVPIPHAMDSAEPVAVEVIDLEEEEADDD